jgi:hypothetical protein
MLLEMLIALAQGCTRPLFKLFPSLDWRTGRPSLMVGMSFIVRQKNTGRYLQKPGEWTNRMEQALQFSSGMNLVRYVETERIGVSEELVEIVVVPTQGPR